LGRVTSPRERSRSRDSAVRVRGCLSGREEPLARGEERARLTAEADDATSTIPIVFAIGGDPIPSGLVARFNRPGGDATGIPLLKSALEAKRLGILHELVPTTSLISVLIDPKMQHAPAQSLPLSSPAPTR
jgi:putative tryptophan/tyrosine transport system substrate-binding protein